MDWALAGVAVRCHCAAQRDAAITRRVRRTKTRNPALPGFPVAVRARWTMIV
jgi:hypothetical protein